MSTSNPERTNETPVESLPPYPEKKSDLKTPSREHRDAPRHSLGKKLGAGAAILLLSGGAALGLNKLGGGDSDVNPFTKDTPSFASANGLTYELNELAPAPTEPTALADMYKSPVGSDGFENIVDAAARDALEGDALTGQMASDFINEQQGELLRDPNTYAALDAEARGELSLYNSLDTFKDSDAAKDIINPPALFTIEDLQSSSAGNLSDGLRKAIIGGAGFSPAGFNRDQQVLKLAAAELGDDGTELSPEVAKLLEEVYADNEFQGTAVDPLTGDNMVTGIVDRYISMRDSDPESVKTNLESPNQITSVNVIDTVFYDFDQVANRGLTTIDAHITYVNMYGYTSSQISRFIVAPANEVSEVSEDDASAPTAMKLISIGKVDLTQ